VPGVASRARTATAGAGRPGEREPAADGAAREDLIALIAELTDQMHAAAAELQFEIAARYRDEIKELKHELRGMQAAGV
jgi:excinuclease ABC subunit B